MEQTKIEQLLWVVVAILVVSVVALVVLPSIRSSLHVTSPEENDCYHGPEAAKYIKRVTHRFDEWDTARTLADQGRRIALAKAVKELQRIRGKSAGLKHPYCAETVHRLMITYMDEIIDAYLALMAKEPNAEVQNKFLRAEVTFLIYRTSLSTHFDNLGKLYLTSGQAKDKQN